EVRGELDALDRAVDAASQRLGEHRLADAGHVLHEQVALGEQHRDDGADDVVLALDDTCHRVLDTPGDPVELSEFLHPSILPYRAPGWRRIGRVTSRRGTP